MSKRFRFILITFLAFSPLSAQSFITLGGGVSGIIYSSEDLSQFSDSYNFRNAPGLAQTFDGPGLGIGPRFEVSYRLFGLKSAAFTGGWLKNRQRDIAQFASGAQRTLELTVETFFLEAEYGLRKNNFFINGLAGFYINRRVTLKSEYSGTDSLGLTRLNGTYTADPHVAFDLGISAGIFKAPFFLIARTSYPIFTGGGNKGLRDNSPAKVAEGSDRFPRDYDEYRTSENYRGATSDIGGLKIMITLSWGFEVGK